MRRLPPVYSPVSFRDLLRGAFVAARISDAGHSELEATLLKNYDAQAVLLCDSGTSSLVAAFSLVCAGGAMSVACPAYVCVDVGAAARAAGVSLILYDTDPKTLSPDMKSLEAAIRAGAGAVLIAHLFGYPIAIGDVRVICRKHGLPLIEDAAQEGGGTIGGRRLGSFGDLTVLSFSRGKGATGGGGGALVLPRDSALQFSLPQPSGARRSGLREWAATAVQWALGRPLLYGIPLAIPGLRLGEMVYHEAHAPRVIASASVAILRGSIAAQEKAVEVQRANASWLADMVAGVRGVGTPEAATGSRPSYLRFPVLDSRRLLMPSKRVGAVRGYPRLLNEEMRLTGFVTSAGALPGATELRDSLFTVPTHKMVNSVDRVVLQKWFEGSDSE